MIKKIFFVMLVMLCLVSLPLASEARTEAEISDWYIKKFNSKIIVNRDSSLDITETILADCGLLPDKHGIFRIVPYQTKISTTKSYQTPIKLKSITDKNGKVYKYSESNNRSDKTLTWKIGDPDKNVSGENEYIIKYHVENAIRNYNSDFDELYWNLNGNFWDIETDEFTANIIFPDGFDRSLSKTSLYSGTFGSTDEGLAKLSWVSDKELNVTSTETLLVKKGITLSLTYPKNFFVAYSEPWYIKYQWLLILIVPILFFVFSFNLWKKYGKDPAISPTIAPEFEIPGRLAPIEMGMIYSDGLLLNHYLSAGIIDLAVKGVIKIEQTTSGTIFKSKDYLLTREEKNCDLPVSEKELLNKLFEGNVTVKISDLKNKFYEKIPKISSKVEKTLSEQNLIIPSSRLWQYGFLIVAIIVLISGIALTSIISYAGIGLIIASVIIAIFIPLMTRRSEEGAKMFKRIQGLKLYMTKAERYRQEFNEKENIFEKFLPYAIMFGITKLWAKKMEAIYGKEFIQNYHPIWYTSAFSTFNFNDFSNEISSLSSEIGNTIASNPSSSGSGGGGFSGGGGGGGGGGGW